MSTIISKNELENVLQGVQGCQAVSLDIDTEVTMNKTGNPYVGARKQNTINGLLGFIYSHSVNNQLAREGKDDSFVAQARKWGERIGKLVYHKGKIYAEIKVQSSGEPTFTFNGEPINKDVLKPFMRENKAPATQEDLEKKVILRDVDLANIRAVRVDGNDYVIGVTEQVEQVTETTPEHVTA